MIDDRRFRVPGRVPGEDVPIVVAVALSLLGAAGLASSASAATRPRAPPTTSPVPGPVPVPVAPPAPAPAPAPDPTAKPCPPVIVSFTLGAPRPSPAAELGLRALAKALIDSPTSTLVLHGHADALGDEDANLRLSRYRAAAVAAVLERDGVARARMTVRGFGAFQPVEGAPEVDASNRRVVIHLRGACPSGLPEIIGP